MKKRSQVFCIFIAMVLLILPLSMSDVPEICKICGEECERFCFKRRFRFCCYDYGFMKSDDESPSLQIPNV
uniref:U-scoloptoxin(20)-Sm1a n=1 Tax=Scolopendra morsitans TaxID=943129 RepID=TXK1A_SCOMO|nr:RecName: Full=U-scoloptoxin(20)-Sm1a; Short=U-SLPTX(20)-Sm1a; Flags: Precursor [Scolopendra morsitans]